MAFIGNNPKFNTGLFKPQSTVPSNPTEGMVYFDDGTNRPAGLWVYKNSTWEEIGSGGGGVDTWLRDDFLVTSASGFETGNSATPFSSGTLAGTLTNETAAPLEGVKSIKYTQASGSLNDWVDLLVPAPLFVKQKDNNFIFFASYDGADNDIEIVVWDATNNVKLNSSAFIKAGTARRYSVQFFIPSSCNDIKIGFQTKVLNSGKILTFDLFELNTNPFNFKDIYNASDWIDAGAMSITATTTNPTKGTIDIDNVRYRFDGPDAIVQYRFRQTTAGTAGSGDYIYDLPAGLFFIDEIPNFTTITSMVINSQATKSFIQSAGVITINSTSGDGIVLAYKYSTNSFRLGLYEFFATGGNQSSSYLALSNANLGYNFEIRFRVKNRTTFAPHLVSNLQPGANWTDLGPMTIGAVTTAPTKGTVVYDKIFLKREGSNAQLRYSYRQTASGTSGTGDYLVNLPILNGTQLRFADNVEVTSAAITNLDNFVWRGYGTGNFVVDTVASATECIIVPYNDFQFRVGVRASSGSAGRFGPSFYGLNNSTTNFSFEFNVPIKGWDIENSVTVLSPLIRRAVFQHRLAAGSNGGTFTSGAWQTRSITHQLSGYDFASHASNQVFIQPGTYQVTAYASAFRVQENRLRLFDLTSELIKGTNAFAGNDNTNGDQCTAHLSGIVEFSTVKTLELQHRCNLTRTTDGFGFTQGTGFGDDEVFMTLIFDKLK